MLFTICIPVFNGELTISESIKSALNQSYSEEYKILIVDNNSNDKTVNICQSFTSPKIKLIKFHDKVLAGKNFQRCIDLCETSYILFLSSDDILDYNCLKKYKNIIDKNKDISVISRTYYWFDQDKKKPIRATNQLYKDMIINSDSKYEDILNFIDSCCQLSGLLIKKNKIINSITPSPFIEIPSIILPIMNKNTVTHLKYNSVAVRYSSSGANLLSAYIKSPSLSWLNLFKENLSKNFDLLDYLSKEYISKNYASLVQIRINGGYKRFLREIIILIKINPKIIFDIKFYLYFFILHLPIIIIENLKKYHKKYSIINVKINNIVE